MWRVTFTTSEQKDKHQKWTRNWKKTARGAGESGLRGEAAGLLPWRSHDEVTGVTVMADLAAQRRGGGGGETQALASAPSLLRSGP